MIAQLRRVLAGAALFVVTGCGLDGLFGSDGGRVNIVLTRDGGALATLVPDSATAWADDRDDDDDDRFKHGFLRFQTATITLSSILARTEDGQLVDLGVDLPVTVDVVKIDGGRQVVLPDGFLPADTYDQVVFVITAVQGVLHDGTVITIEPPGGGWTAVVPICTLEVLDGDDTSLDIAFNVRNSFIQLSNWWSFQPRFRSLVECD